MFKFYSSYALLYTGITHLLCCGVPIFIGITSVLSNLVFFEMILHRLEFLEFFEIPLLIESKLMNRFNVIIFIKAKKNIRLRRFLLKGGSRKIFEILDKKQLSDRKKEIYSDHVIVNDKNKKILKKNLMDILAKYE